MKKAKQLGGAIVQKLPKNAKKAKRYGWTDADGPTDMAGQSHVHEHVYTHVHNFTHVQTIKHAHRHSHTHTHTLTHTRSHTHGRTKALNRVACPQLKREGESEGEKERGNT